MPMILIPNQYKPSSGMLHSMGQMPCKGCMPHRQDCTPGYSQRLAKRTPSNGILPLRELTRLQPKWLATYRMSLSEKGRHFHHMVWRPSARIFTAFQIILILKDFQRPALIVPTLASSTSSASSTCSKSS